MPAFPTSTTVFDSILFRDAFGTPAMREMFSDFALISRYAEVEIALAKAEARCGVIPLAGLSARYRDTPMAGRTHLQQALPVLLLPGGSLAFA